MQSNDEFTITSKQLIFIIIGTMLGTGIMSLPRLAAKEVGQDAWFAVILGSLFPLASLSLIRFLYKKNNSTGFVNVCRKAGGGFLGSIFSAMLALYSIFAAAIFLRNFIELASMFLLIETPIFVQMVLMLAACAYLALGNAKYGTVTNFFYCFPAFVILLAYKVKNFDIRNLMPTTIRFLIMSKRRLQQVCLSGFELYIVSSYVSEKKAYCASLYALLITYSYICILLSAQSQSSEQNLQVYMSTPAACNKLSYR